MSSDSSLPGGMHVVDLGQGTPILFIHGFPLDHSMWRFQIERFQKSHRILAVDLPGFGKSPAGAGVMPMAEFADRLAAMLDVKGVTEKVVVCGLSMGGLITWPFVEKFADRILGLILCDTRALPDSPEVAEGRKTTADRVLKEGPGFIAEAMLPRLFCDESRRDRKEIIEQTRQTILSGNPEGIAAAARGMAARPDRTSLLPQIPAPALVIVGEHDVISTVTEMTGMAQAIPQASLLEVPGAGHMAPLEAPDKVNPAIEKFLTQLEA
jgi:pimeloyl-ACP methyl ester carboxylesterase